MQLGTKGKFNPCLRGGPAMQKKDKILAKLVISICIFFIIGLISLALWSISLVNEIKRAEIRREELKEDMEKIKILKEANNNFIKDVLRQRAITLCFWELIGEHKKKYYSKEIQDCIQLIVMTDEKHGHKGFNAPLILAWLEKESNGNPRAISYAGAKGLSQLMDFRAEELLTAMGYPGFDEELVFNPVVNLTSGLYHLNDLMNFWERQGTKNQSLILFYALHSYKWGSKNTEELFDSPRRAYRPAIEYVNWILNRQEYWSKKLEYWANNTQKSTKKDK